MVLPNNNFCQVCSRRLPIDRKRFDGLCCNACAIFFMRSYKIQHFYYCLKVHKCLILPTIIGAKCRKCRYRKCLEVGMLPPKVEISSSNLPIVSQKPQTSEDHSKLDGMESQKCDVTSLLLHEPKQQQFLDEPETSTNNTKFDGKVLQNLATTSQLPTEPKQFENKSETAIVNSKFFATNVHCLIKSFSQRPDLLIAYLQDCTPKLLKLDGKILDNNDEKIIDSLIEIFSTHENISMAEFPSLLYALTCFLKIIGLNESLQGKLEYFQVRQYQKYFVDECILSKETKYLIFKLCELCLSCY